MMNLLHSPIEALPSLLLPVWPKTLPVIALTGMTLASFLAIPWAFFDARRDEKLREELPRIFYTRIEENESRINTYAPFWRLTAGALAASLTLASIHAFVYPQVVVGYFQPASLQDIESSRAVRSVDLPQSSTPDVVWSISPPPSTRSTAILAAAQGPIVIRDGKGSVVQAISKKDGSEIWRWGLNPLYDFSISTLYSATSPDGQYVALAIKDSQDNDSDSENSPLYVVVLDAKSGKEIWGIKPGNASRGKILLTNRVILINRQVFHLETGKMLWELGAEEHVVSLIGSKETLLTSVYRDPEEEYQLSGNPTCECSASLFTPRDDLTGQPKGQAFTGVVLDDNGYIAATKGWILLHNRDAHTNSLHNIDTGKEISVPRGIPSYQAEEHTLTYGGAESLTLSFSTPFPNPEGPKIRRSYIFNPETISLIPLNKELPEFSLTGIYYFPSGKDSIIQPNLLIKRAAPILRLRDPNTGDILKDITLWNLTQLAHDEEDSYIRQLVRTNGGWVLLVRGGGDRSSQERPIQIVMIK
ncbi:MAG: PQQ-binding-like beta-propeller repeat protein [Actinomycetaceae bacterium]|nr:PQQ-binding-like beta-propeller repeat protein [Actinomycetaceae bacterium]